MITLVVSNCLIVLGGECYSSYQVDWRSEEDRGCSVYTDQC